MIALRSKQRYGERFGAHRFRASLETTQAIMAGDRPMTAPLILDHSPEIAIKHYVRAGNLEASRSHDERVTAVEDAALPCIGLERDALTAEHCQPLQVQRHGP